MSSHAAATDRGRSRHGQSVNTNTAEKEHPLISSPTPTHLITDRHQYIQPTHLITDSHQHIKPTHLITNSHQHISSHHKSLTSLQNPSTQQRSVSITPTHHHHPEHNITISTHHHHLVPLCGGVVHGCVHRSSLQRRTVQRNTHRCGYGIYCCVAYCLKHVAVHLI